MTVHSFDPEMLARLYKALAELQTPEDAEAMLADLCTRKEVEQMAQRLQAARLLMEGKTYSQVIEMTNISSATLSRVSRCVQYGDGYRRFAEPDKNG